MRTTEEMQELYDKYEHLIHTTIHKKGYGQKVFLELHGITPDDLMQHGRLGLHQACKKYDSAKNTSFRTFAISNIIWTINTESKKESLSKDTSWTFDTIDKVSLDSVTPECEGEVANLHEVVSDSHASESFNSMEKAQLMHSLELATTKRVVEIVELKLQGYEKNTDVAEILGVTHQNVSALLRRYKKEIKSVLFA